MIGSQEISRVRAVLDFCSKYGLSWENIHTESDFKNALLLFIRGEGVLVSEGLYQRIPEEECRQLEISEFYGGLGIAWTGEMNPLLRSVIKFMEKYDGAAE